MSAHGEIRCPPHVHDHARCDECRGPACPSCDFCPGCGRLICLACNTEPAPALPCPDGLGDHPQIEAVP